MKFSVYTTALAVFLMVLVLFFALFEFEQWRVLKQQRSTLESQVVDVQRQLSQFAVLSSLLATDPRVVNVLQSHSTPSVAVANQLLLHLVSVSDATFAFVMDGEGTTLAASNFAQEVSFVGNNYAFRPYFTGAIEGAETTFFAVGATTGVPGYFTATPVFVEDAVVGVVVVKIESEELPSLWRESGSGGALVIDEFGVVLLATDETFLYTSTRPLDRHEKDAIEAERRYTVSANQAFARSDVDRWQLTGVEGKSQDFLVVSLPLEVEPWMLSLLYPRWQIFWRALVYWLALVALLLIVGLLWRLFRQQNQLAIMREREARELELLVSDRTKELQDTQQALIAESNFAMLGKMSAAINHEVNQPLASLRLNLASLRGVLETTEASPEEIRDIVVDCDRTTKRISRVIETLRSVARQTSSGFSRLNVNQLVSEIENTVRRERPQMSRCLSIRCDSVTTEFRGNEVLLQQALLNLLYNAFDAVLQKKDPQVVLTVQLEDGIREGLVFQVLDNGAGVPVEMEAHLFEPFESDPGKATGMGLGLMLARQIAHDHGGLLLYSRRDKSGSCFSLHLPKSRKPINGSVAVDE